MPRTKLHIYDPFNRDASWITDEVIEDYAAAELRGGNAPDICLQKWTNFSTDVINARLKINQFLELISVQPDFELIKEELLEEFGEAYFVGQSRTIEYHIRQLELRMASERDNEIYVKLAKQLADMRGWTTKAVEKPAGTPAININNPNVVLDRNNPRETERIVMSIFGSI